METAIRWSPSSTISEQRFLIADVNGRTFRHCKVDKYGDNGLEYSTLSTQRKVPPFRAFDWSPHDENLIAIGQWSGEATVLRLNNEAQHLSLPIKHQRLCNAVAFGHDALLATGLERVRNDFCLNIWDINRVCSCSRTNRPSHTVFEFSDLSLEFCLKKHVLQFNALSKSGDTDFERVLCQVHHLLLQDLALGGRLWSLYAN